MIQNQPRGRADPILLLEALLALILSIVIYLKRR